MTTPMVAMPAPNDRLIYDHTFSAIAGEQQSEELNEFPACIARENSFFDSYRHRGSRKGRVKPRHKVNSSSSWKNSSPTQTVCRDSNFKAKDRVSPMSIIDLPHLQKEDDVGIDSPCTVACEETDSFLSGYVELKQLQHPLASTNASGNSAGSGFMEEFPLSLSKVALARTSTPRDCLPINSWNQDDSLSEILGSNDTDFMESSEKFHVEASEAAVLSMTPAIVLGHTETSASNALADCMCSSLTTSRKVNLLSSAFRKSPQTADMVVSFNETMEVRYFYRSDDEIAIMKQCALERRRQQESRRRLRRARQGMRATTSLLRSNKLASMFYHGCTDDGILKGMSRADILDDDEINHYEDDDFDGSVFHCGMHFQRHDEQSDAESDDDMPLNVQDEHVRGFAFRGMVDGLSSMISEVMIDANPIDSQTKSDDDTVPVDKLPLANVDDEDASDPWFISSLCGNHSLIITLKE